MGPLQLSPKAYAMIPDELKHAATEVAEHTQADNDTLADMATVNLMDEFVNAACGYPCVKITNYSEARRLIKEAFLTVFEAACNGKNHEFVEIEKPSDGRKRIQTDFRGV